MPDITGNATLSGTDSEDEPLKEVLKYIQIIEQKEIDITAGYANWLRIGYALHNAFRGFRSGVISSGQQFPSPIQLCRNG